jgi:hypothetical protein
MYQTDITGRQGDRDARTHERPGTGSEFHVFGGVQVGAGVARMGVGRQRQIRVQTANGHRDAVVPHGAPFGRRTPPILPRRPPPWARTLGYVARYHERLTVPWWWWLAAPAFAALFAAEIFLGAPGVATWVPYLILVPLTLFGLWWLGRIRIAVTDTELVVDDARLPLRFIAGVVALDGLTKRDLLGPNAEPYAFVIQRPWIAGAVQVWLNDPADPTPYWVISSRRPDRLAEALASASARAA